MYLPCMTTSNFKCKHFNIKIEGFKGSIHSLYNKILFKKSKVTPYKNVKLRGKIVRLELTKIVR